MEILNFAVLMQHEIHENVHSPNDSTLTAIGKSNYNV